jgi:hypothetical protein
VVLDRVEKGLSDGFYAEEKEFWEGHEEVVGGGQGGAAVGGRGCEDQLLDQVEMNNPILDGFLLDYEHLGHRFSGEMGMVESMYGHGAASEAIVC